jgi:hypothetical protein
MGLQKMQTALIWFRPFGVLHSLQELNRPSEAFQM